MKLVVRHDPVFVRRRRIVGLVTLVLLALLVLGLVRACQGLTAGRDDAAASALQEQSRAFDVGSTHLVSRQTITGAINPKSVAASPTGLVLAQNMMYRHTVTAYSADGQLKATVNDAVDLGAYGVAGSRGTVKGAPVEAVWTRDGAKAYVSNYSMYGAGFEHNGYDDCTTSSTVDRSYLYRLDAASLKVDQAIQVGAVPKVVALTPNQRTVLATNWCSGTLSIVDVAQAKEVGTVAIGAHPRGIAVSPDSRTAYVAEMGGETVYAVDLESRTAKPLVKPGKGPRALVLSADGKHLYVTNNDADTLVRVDVATGRVDRSVRLADQPRSMAISTDGRALYVVSYGAATLTKVRVSDLTVQQTVATGPSPIGVAYEPTRNAVWVSCYSGSIMLLDESRAGAPAPAPKGTPSASASGPAHD
ncbi:YncE family protein [Arsenicicoccus sp. oral taxon 190]|uniref:YncE family protein n=1 Tax=Arsenicicoccus sp. oral taxon 190 TaxID=1658671 RepID=UPI00067E349E|nr:beta-propeller fold lactonase family protein [Arsenicicoccus sp. oral taxon 190]